MYNLPMKQEEILIFMRVGMLHSLSFQTYAFMNIEKITQNTRLWRKNAKTRQSNDYLQMYRF